jgi:hypothetical protein
MALARYGTGIVEIRGSLGGQYHSRDGSGNHISSQPRVIKRRTSLQKAQRDAFARARRFCDNYTCIKVNMFRMLNNLPLKHVHDE